MDACPLELRSASFLVTGVGTDQECWPGATWQLAERIGERRPGESVGKQTQRTEESELGCNHRIAQSVDDPCPTVCR